MKIDVSILKQAVAKLIQSKGEEKQTAHLVADVLVQADMRGIHSHGCALVATIVDRIEAGLLAVPTSIERITDEGAVALIDGNNGFGQAAATAAMEISVTKATQFGIAATLVRHTNNVGFLGYYPTLAAARGMVGIGMTNAAATIAPWGGTEAFFGTNPVSFACPVAGEAPIVLDMSSSLVARGKIRRAERQGEEIPVGWALDAEGRPTTDPAEAIKGTLLPMGGPKGYGLALMVDLLCGLLSGSKFGRDLLTFHKPLGPTGVGGAFIAIDTSRFMPLDHFEALVKDYAQAVRASRKAQGVDCIFMPGEIEAGNAAAAVKHGAELDEQVVEKLNRLLAENDISIDVKGT